MDNSPKGWHLNAEHAPASQFEKFAGSHRREYASLFANLDKIVGLLESGNKIGGFHVNFFRSESSGVYRIGQTGVAHAKESRLYIYPDEELKTIYILGIGDKDSQSDDIIAAQELVEKIRSKTKKKS